MVERGTGTITAGGVTTHFGAPTRPEQAVMPTQISPEETQLKKFYTEQYRIEVNAFARNSMPQQQFDRGVRKLQTKYKLAFNNAKMRMDQPDPAFKRYSELETLYGKVSKDFEGPNRVYQWTGGEGKEQLEKWDPTLGKEGEWTSKGLKHADYERAAKTTLEMKRIRAEQNTLMSGRMGLLGTAAVSPRMGGARTGGSIRDQTRAYLDQRSGIQQQEAEDLSQLSDDELRRIVEGR